MKNLFLSLFILFGAISAHATGECTDVKLSTELQALTTCESKTEVIIYNSKYCVSTFREGAMSLTDSENFTLDVNYGSVPCGNLPLQTRGYEFCTVGVEFTPVTNSGTFSTALQVTNGVDTFTTEEITGEIDPCCSGSQCDGKVTDLTLAYYGEQTAKVEVFQGKYKDYLKTLDTVEDKHGKKHHKGKCDTKRSYKKKHYYGRKHYKKDRHHKKEAINIYTGTLNPEDIFSFTGVDKKGTLGTKIFILVNGELNAEIHTSCSKPIGPDLMVGDFTVVSGSSLNGGLLSSVTCVIEEAPEKYCKKKKHPKKRKHHDDKNSGCTEGNCDGKVTQLTLQNNGLSSFITVTETKTGAILIDNVYIETATTFDFFGSNDDLTMGTWINVTATTDAGVETTTPIHTSCSVPIGPGAEFGTFKVISGFSKNGGELAAIVCPTDTTTNTTTTDSTTTMGTTNYLASLNLVRPTDSTNVYVENDTLVFDGYNSNGAEGRAVIQFDEVANSSTVMMFDANLTSGIVMPVPYSDDGRFLTTDVKQVVRRYGFIFPNIALDELHLYTWNTSVTGTFSNISLVDYVNPSLLP